MLRFAEKIFPISPNMNQVLRILQYKNEQGEWVDVPVVTLQEQHEEKVVHTIVQEKE